MALGLAAAGRNVLITAASNTAEEIESVVRWPRQPARGGTVIPLVADVASKADCRRTVEPPGAAIFGAVHILVNIAARGMRFISESFLEKPTPFWQSDGAGVADDCRCQRERTYLMAKAVGPAFN